VPLETPDTGDVTRWRASPNCCSEISTPSTCPLGRTASANLSAVVPVPQPISRTLSPDFGAAAVRAASVTLAMRRSMRVCSVTQRLVASLFQNARCAIAMDVVSLMSFPLAYLHRPGSTQRSPSPLLDRPGHSGLPHQVERATQTNPRHRPTRSYSAVKSRHGSRWSPSRAITAWDRRFSALV
jgi:hypothetical protein